MDPCIKTQQKLLKKFGFPPGPIDGIAGRRTKLALSEALGPDIIDRDIEAGEVPSHGKNWPTRTMMERFYGPPGTNHKLITPLYPLRLAWDLTYTISKMRVNKQCAESTDIVLHKVLKHYGIDEIKKLGLDIYAGTFNDRPVRGGTVKSTHAYAAAHDFHPTKNQLRWHKDKALFAKPEYVKWWEFWEEEGWVSLGRAKDYDWMHVQAVRL